MVVRGSSCFSTFYLSRYPLSPIHAHPIGALSYPLDPVQYFKIKQVAGNQSYNGQLHGDECTRPAPPPARSILCRQGRRDHRGTYNGDSSECTGPASRGGRAASAAPAGAATRELGQPGTGRICGTYMLHDICSARCLWKLHRRCGPTSPNFTKSDATNFPPAGVILDKFVVTFCPFFLLLSSSRG